LKQVSTGPSRHKGPPQMRRPFPREDQPATELQLTVGVSSERLDGAHPASSAGQVFPDHALARQVRGAAKL
jgi:hypothetical protein